MTDTADRSTIDRRTALGVLGAGGIAAITASALAQGPAHAPEKPGEKPAGGPPPGAAPFTPESMGWDASKGEYVLPKLPYAYNALEPHIDAQTMEIHHSKHHTAYVAGLNKALAELAKIRSGENDAALVKHWSRELSFQGGGHVNHAMFWLNMAPAGGGGGGEPSGKLADQIKKDFGAFDVFAKHFFAASIAVEGSGWGWLVFDHVSRRLLIQQMEKQQNLLMTAATPLLGVDVWEHAYYLKYQQKRADYVKAFFNVVNWPRVQATFEHAAG